ncbi:MAG: phosphoribosylamine--glycine ligase [Thermomicrobiales bacterium]|nr:MAG: phosphoribosylamine--glycine ligase [Thermomicrobiales bacterium]
MGMRILVVGGGAREHALVWKLAQSPLADALYCAPGNAGTEALATNLPLRASDIDGIVAAARTHGIDLVVVGPEEPLALGLADRLRAAGVAVCGPSASATRIESSKAWAKELMVAAGVPTARAVVVYDLAEGMAALDRFSLPVVIKADGLAAGKGVVIANTRDEAFRVLSAFLEERTLGDAGTTVVIEEYLTGQEVSVLALTDGETIIPLPPACDYKRVYDGDRGPNTGGMGAYAPPPAVDADLMATIRATILEPAIRAMAERGAPMQGVLYAGLMLTASGPHVLEFNARFGDPEAQVILPILDADLVLLLDAVARGTLAEAPPPPPPARAAVGVVLASGGYPGPYQTGVPISGLDHAPEDVLVFHAGTRRAADGRIVTAGGRVLTVVGVGPDLATARERAYAGVERISFEGAHWRRDIALREIPAQPAAASEPSQSG